MALRSLTSIELTPTPVQSSIDEPRERSYEPFAGVPLLWYQFRELWPADVPSSNGPSIHGQFPPEQARPHRGRPSAVSGRVAGHRAPSHAQRADVRGGLPEGS